MLFKREVNFSKLETLFGAQLAHVFVLHSMFTWQGCQPLAAATMLAFVSHHCAFQQWSQHLWPHKRLCTAAAGLRCPQWNRILKHTSLDVWLASSCDFFQGSLGCLLYWILHLSTACQTVLLALGLVVALNTLILLMMPKNHVNEVTLK